ncbi:alpha/beta fold hydrolase [Schaalia sp. ZJ405]|uniref:alpha/beta fold hydrolase n=1 Tax=Schaalia sp. ZJ405 TaxID=2709403 RepID=UPI0013ED0797|nr:alpha/beta fold hydrolase [Schaalia sp. ZJ405]QPK81441.1 alpha/beta fold hydrolase [Schaalia sp. ZJ405]
MMTLTYTQHSCTINEHRIEVPLDHSRPTGPDNPSIGIFAREIVRSGGESLPHLVFLQGGPGGASPRQSDFRDGWIGRALEHYRVVLLDQRGTGQSTHMDWQYLSSFASDAERAHYLSFFRQDQIVRDAEALRKEITGGAPWTSLGQSFGGFITLSYLSLAPEGLAASLITGGLPGLVPIDDIYRQTYAATAVRNRAYLDRYPWDERTIREIAAHLRDTEEFLPTGERLSTERFRMIGIGLGLDTRFDMLHYLVECPWVSVRGQRRLSENFLHQVASEVAMVPMYGVLQESIYAGATPDLAGTRTRWAADRLAEEIPGFAKDADPLNEDEPYFLTGEHMMRTIFDEDPTLRHLAGTANELAEKSDWNPVYLPDVLASNTVPVAAAVYYDDMFVPRELSLDTASVVPGVRTWVTNEYQHDGVRASGGKVFDHLHAMLND